MKIETRAVDATSLRRGVAWRRTVTAVPCVLGVTFFAVACGDDIQSNPSGLDGPLGGVVVAPTEPPPGTGPVPGTNAPPPASTEGPNFDPTATAVPTDPDGMMGCAGEMSQAETPGLDMYVVLDHTGSMGVDCPLDLATSPVVPPTNDPDDNKWCFATHAVGEYFTSTIATGNRAALQFMSVENDFASAVGGANSYVCDAGDNNPHATAHVGLTVLPVDVTNPLIQALSEDDPQAPLNVLPRAGGGGGGGGLGGLGTRVEAALRGITTFTAANQDPVRTMIGILITDGDPNGCEEDPDALAQVVGNHLAQTGLRTFIIGMTGASLDNLEVIAAAGGAPAHGPEFCGNDGNGNPIPSCHYWSVGDGDPAAFVSALEQIQQVALLPCDYTIPAAPLGMSLDLDEVNVLFTPPDAPMGTVIGRVESEAGCGAAGGVGWFYDDPVNATTIRLCESSCTSAMTAADGTSINVQFGCATILQ